jgi:hypothetical protein
MARIALEPYFLHEEQVQGLLGPERATAAVSSGTTAQIASANPMPYVLATALAEALPYLNVPELQRAVHENKLRVGNAVGVEQTFHFRRNKRRDEINYKPVEFSAALTTDTSVTVMGTFNAVRLVSHSAAGSLSGDRPAYILGTVTECKDSQIRIRPAFVGVRTYLDDEHQQAYGITSGRRVYPTEIDQFTSIDFLSTVTPSDVKQVLKVPEEVVKTTVARMLDEHYVHKDWGGERSDLYTSRLRIKGRQVSSAWLFKGPGFPRPMTVKALGAPGDQIDRLFSQSAEVLVLQHCHEITPAVVSMMETYAYDLRNPRRYMIIDGTDTARILRDQGKLTKPT